MSKTFDRDMVKHFRYHAKLVTLCRILAAIHADAKLFNALAPKAMRNLDNTQIRWRLEDEIRELLRQNGDWETP